MNFTTFLGEVQRRAHLSDTQEAYRATRATLQTLAERADCNQVRDLAAQLADDLGAFLACELGHVLERFSVDEFFLRVSEREGVELPEGTRHAQVVIEVLREAAPPGHISIIEAQLPGEYVRLFAPGAERPG